jgi:beta-N-acetylhexosaminidase
VPRARKEPRISTRTASVRVARAEQQARRPRRALAATGLLISCALASAACSSGTPSQAASSPAGGGTTGSASAGATGSSPAASSASPSASTAHLSNVQLAGQRVIYSYTGTTPPTELLTLIREGEVGGVIFFSSNITSGSQLAGAVKELNEAQAKSVVHLPLLLMTDQEGGIVRRIPNGQPTVSQRQIGQSANPAQAAAQAGSGAAQTLSASGLNVNLAPVLDVFAVPGNFDDQFGRSYSSDPNVVSSAGASFITAQQNGGVAATAKHFPGLGTASTHEDTDNIPVTLNEPLSQIRAVDELPYVAAIKANVDLIMVSWAVYPALDSSRPAGLSSTIVQGELRNRLGYGGVTVTDALEAGALKAYGGPGQRAVDAASAGMDLLLCSSGSVSQGEEATQALAAALQGGQLTNSSFNAAVSRVDSLRERLR